ncbi:hypothetical protein PR003_g26236 [Phytophthora rubi]|uniref:Uncharacterized protein n=1 Tax=Phytophthora rubi TaxID=129364 RepID=A0A6A4CA83_9STRA|nr:hypothetical protein PR003_g26236 [Phytophthora rubi]
MPATTHARKRPQPPVPSHATTASSNTSRVGLPKTSDRQLLIAEVVDLLAIAMALYDGKSEQPSLETRKSLESKFEKKTLGDQNETEDWVVVKELWLETMTDKVEINKNGRPVGWRGQSWVYYKTMMMIAFEDKDVADFVMGTKTAVDTKDQEEFDAIQAKIKLIIMG